MTLLMLSSAPPPPWLLPVAVAGAAVLALVIILAARMSERKRTQGLETAAMQVGLSYQLEDQALPADEMKRFQLFTAGHGQRTRHVMRGSSGGMEIVVFDYRYVTGSGKNSSSHNQTVAAFHLAGAAFPNFTLGPETFVHRIAEHFGFQDFDFEAHPEFSRRYVLRGTDEKAVRQLFGPALVDFFEAQGGEARWSVEGSGDWLLIFHAERLVKPAQLPEFLQQTSTVAGAFRTDTGAAKFGW